MNLAVLAQAAVIAVLVLLVPLAGAAAAARRHVRRAARRRSISRRSALGFLFIEIVLIEQASLWLNDRTSGFAVVLTGMLVFSGLGSMAADRLCRAPRRGDRRCGAGGGMVWCVAVRLGLQPLMLATLAVPWTPRAALVLAVLAPSRWRWGCRFPLGLSRVGRRRRAALGLGAERRLLGAWRRRWPT